MKETDDWPENAIRLEIARRSRCKHWNVRVDEQLGMCECVNCGEQLNPMNVLMRFAREGRPFMLTAAAVTAATLAMAVRSPVAA